MLLVQSQHVDDASTRIPVRLADESREQADQTESSRKQQIH